MRIRGFKFQSGKQSVVNMSPYIIALQDNTGTVGANTKKCMRWPYIPVSLATLQPSDVTSTRQPLIKESTKQSWPKDWGRGEEVKRRREELPLLLSFPLVSTLVCDPPALQHWAEQQRGLNQQTIECRANRALLPWQREGEKAVAAGTYSGALTMTTSLRSVWPPKYNTF
jgi:hypothetical protein